MTTLEFDWQALAIRLLRHEGGRPTDPEELAAAADRVLAKLQAGLSVLIGELGVSALTLRAVVTARRSCAELGEVTFDAAPGAGISGLAAALTRADEGLKTELAAAVPHHLLRLLGELIGEELTLRSIRAIWSDGVLAAPDREM